MPSSIQAAPSGARSSTAPVTRRRRPAQVGPVAGLAHHPPDPDQALGRHVDQLRLVLRDHLHAGMGPGGGHQAPQPLAPGGPGQQVVEPEQGPQRGAVRRRRGGGQAQAAAADVDQASLARLRSDHRLLTCVADDGGQAPMAVDHMGQAHRTRVDGTVVEGPGAALDHDGHGLPLGRGVEADQGGHQIDGIGARRSGDRGRRVHVVHTLVGQADEHRRTAPARLLGDGVELTGDGAQVTDGTMTGATGAGHGASGVWPPDGRASKAPVRSGREPTASLPGPCDSRALLLQPSGCPP